MNKIEEIFDNEECNVLAQAITNAAQAQNFNSSKVYDFLEEMPRNSMVVEIVNALADLGYTIYAP